MQILLWLVPPVLVTLVTMAWVGWLGREGRGEIDRDEAARRIGAALEREPRPRRRSRTASRPAPGADPSADPRDPGAPAERSSGVVVRRARPATAPARVTPVAPVEPLPAPRTTTVPEVPADTPAADQPARRAS